MTIPKRPPAIAAVAAFVFGLSLLAAHATESAPSGGPWAIERHTVQSGAEFAAEGGIFRVRGTVGQVAADARSTGSDWQLDGGFWIGRTRTTDRLFKDDFEPGVTP